MITFKNAEATLFIHENQGTLKFKHLEIIWQIKKEKKEGKIIVRE